MGFSFNPITYLKGELLKYKDKAGTPVVIDAIEKVEVGLTVVQQFVNKLDANDVKEILALLPAATAAKFTPAEIDAVSAAVANLPKDIDEAETGLKNLETELEAK